MHQQVIQMGEVVHLRQAQVVELQLKLVLQTTLEEKEHNYKI